MRRTPLAAGFVMVATVSAVVVLSASPRGVLQVATAVVVGSLVVALGASKYRKRLTTSDHTDGSRHAPTSTLPPLPTRQTFDRYWYPAAATRDRTGTRLGGSRRHGAVESMCFEVDNSTNAPANARQALQTWFLTVNCPVALSDGALLIVSELVTNVVVHTTSSSVVTAAFDDHRFRIEVHDHDPQGPVVTPEAAGTGRGLDVVEILCDLWGWEPTAIGKRVWTETLY